MRRGFFIVLCIATVMACNLSYQGSTNQDIVTSVPSISTVSITPQPRLSVKGHVYLRDGSGLAGARIYRRFASYPGVLVATTDETGYYRCEFVPIPGDEMVSVWSELEGYSITPKDSTWTWEKGKYSWRHYNGFEERVMDFIADE
jgi:hypothetical protein